MVSLATGLPVSLSDNLNQLGYTQDAYGGKGPKDTAATSVETARGTQTGVSVTNKVSSTPQAIAALNALIATLQGGGSDENKNIAKAREEEIGRARQLQGQFSPEMARATGNSLIAKAISDALAQLIPGITAASEGAGTSKGSMRALLTQKAAEHGAIEGAALGANLSTAYGGLQANFEQTLNELTKQDPNGPLAQLAQLIIGSKGIVESGVTSSSGTSQTVGNKQGISKESGQITYEGTTRQPLTGYNPNSPNSAYPASTFSGEGSMAIAEGSTNNIDTTYEGLTSNSDNPLFYFDEE